jgi:hypothetical protein
MTTTTPTDLDQLAELLPELRATLKKAADLVADQSDTES